MKATVGKVWEAASKDSSSRPALTHVWFDAEKGTLTASDSYIMARVPCEVEDGDESGAIPAAAIKQAAGKSLAVRDGKATLSLPDGERIWDLFDGVMPDFDKLWTLHEGQQAEARFGVNPDLFKALGVALGAGGRDYVPLVIEPYHPLKPIVATAKEGAKGLLMPVRLAGERPPLSASAMFANDEAVLKAAKAAVFALERKRGVKRAATMFRKTLAEAAA